jgi:2-polyprenyl-3-methyl-5-hydroxy-6-metoxy-1,4-benzoquinol methylase
VNEQEIKNEVRRLAPFLHAIDLPHGLSTYVPELSRRDIERTRLPNLVAHAWPALLERCGGSLEGRRVLDVACNSGGFSVEAAKSGADFVLGVDVVDRYLEQAQLVKRALGLDNVEFRQLAAEDLDPSVTGTFDVTLCFGILYHLENPVATMKRVAAVTEDIMVVDTKLDPSNPTEPYWRMMQRGPPLPDAVGASTAQWIDRWICQFTPTARAVEELMHFLQFPQVTQLEPAATFEDRYRMGERATFIAARS